MRRAWMTLCVVAAALLAMVVPAPALAGQNPTWERLGGGTRYETMSLIVGAAGTRAKTAVVATGQDYPDALAASALAGAYGSPVILTNSQSLSSEASALLTSRGIRDVVVLGGPSAVSEEVKQQIEGIVAGSVRRVSGDDRVATSLEALDEVRAAGASSKTIIIATGSNYADALSISPWAWYTASPIVLTKGDGTLSDAAVAKVRSDSRARRIVLVGGRGVVSDDVVTQLGGSGRFEFVRLEGADRYQTSRRIAEWEVEQGGFSWRMPMLATGKDFPDALSGSVLGGTLRSPLLLANATTDTSLAALLDHDEAITAGYVLGGPAALDLPLGTLFEVDDVVDRILGMHAATGREGLRYAYDYISQHYDYVQGNIYPQGDWTRWTLDYALEMDRNGGGNCYRFASVMTWCARALGYDARLVQGHIISNGSLAAHSWVEVREQGQTYILDADLQKFIDRNFFMVTYDGAPLQYYRLDGTAY